MEKCVIYIGGKLIKLLVPLEFGVIIGVKPA
jgi:hypothetical protein